MRVTVVLGCLLGVCAWSGAGEFERFALRETLVRKADVILLGEVTHVEPRESARKMLRKKTPQAWPIAILPEVVLKGQVEGALELRVRVSGSGHYLDACGDERPVRSGDRGAWYFVRDEDGLHLEAFVHVERTLAYLGRSSRHKRAGVAEALACERATVERYVHEQACGAALRAFSSGPRGEAGRPRLERALAALEAYGEAERAFFRAYAPKRKHEADYILEVLRDPRRKLERAAGKKGLALPESATAR